MKLDGFPAGAEPSAAAGRAAAEPSPARRGYVLALLTLVYAVSSMDRQIMAVLAEPIRRDLALSDSEYGLLAGFLFAAFYTVSGIPLAWLADRANRVKVIAAACALWSLFAGAFGLAQNFVHMAAARAGLAIGEAGSSPASYSILSDIFPPASRGRAVGVFSLGVPIGTAVAIGGAAWIANAYGWRAAFLAGAVPGLVLVLLLLFTVAEPPRDALPMTPSVPLRESLRSYFGNPPLALLTAAASTSIVAGYGVMMWAPAFLMRSGGMSLAQLGSVFAIGSGLALGAGMYGSGWLADRIASRGNVWRMALLPAASQVLAAAALAIALLSGRWELSIWPMLVALTLIASYFPPTMTLVQHSVPADRRAVAAAILLFCVGLFGSGGGPLLIGWMSDSMHAYGPDISLRIGMASVIPFFLLSSLFYRIAAQTGARSAR